MTCSNQIKQIVLAMHNHCDVNQQNLPYGTDATPVSATNSGRHYSFIIPILPFIEQNALYENIAQTISSPNSWANSHRHNKVADITCPSDGFGMKWGTETCGRGNYMCSAGDYAPYPPENRNFTTETNSFYSRGTSQPQVRVGLESITDGTSNTVVISERLSHVLDRVYTSGTKYPLLENLETSDKNYYKTGITVIGGKSSK
jgi:hypothetical protein